MTAGEAKAIRCQCINQVMGTIFRPTKPARLNQMDDTCISKET